MKCWYIYCFYLDTILTEILWISNKQAQQILGGHGCAYRARALF